MKFQIANPDGSAGTHLLMAHCVTRVSGQRACHQLAGSRRVGTKMPVNYFGIHGHEPLVVHWHVMWNFNNYGQCRFQKDS